jgi:hypothetical protein
MWVSYKQVKGEVFPTHTRKLYRGNGGLTPFIHNRAMMDGVNEQIKASVILSQVCLCFSLAKRDVWASEPDWKFWIKKMLLPMSGSEPQIVRPVASSLYCL